MEPQITTTSTVRVKYVTNYSDGDLVCVQHPNKKGLVARRIVVNKDTYNFISINPNNYPSFEINKNEASIIGKITQIITNIE